MYCLDPNAILFNPWTFAAFDFCWQLDLCWILEFEIWSIGNQSTHHRCGFTTLTTMVEVIPCPGDHQVFCTNGVKYRDSGPLPTPEIKRDMLCIKITHTYMKRLLRIAEGGWAAPSLLGPFFLSFSFLFLFRFSLIYEGFGPPYIYFLFS